MECWGRVLLFTGARIKCPSISASLILLSPRQACHTKTQCASQLGSGKHSYHQLVSTPSSRRGTQRGYQCAREGTVKASWVSNLERRGSGGASEVISNICRANVEESQAREGHREAHFNPVLGAFQLLHCPQNGLQSIVMNNLVLERFKPRLDGSI